jgi:hypothetical protein
MRFVSSTLAQWAALPELKKTSLDAGVSCVPDRVSMPAQLLGNISHGEQPYRAPSFLEVRQERPVATVRPLIRPQLRRELKPGAAPVLKVVKPFRIRL